MDQLCTDGWFFYAPAFGGEATRTCQGRELDLFFITAAHTVARTFPAEHFS